MTEGETDYSEAYNDFWTRGDRIGTTSANVEQFANLVSSNCGFGSVLDIGCGEGFLVGEFLKLGLDAYGVDVSSVVLDRANERYLGRFKEASVLELPYRDDSFDITVSMDCLEHISPSDVPQAIGEIYRVTAKYAFLQIATTQDRDNHWHLTVEKRAWWEALFFKSGFRKHPAYYRVNGYEGLNNESWQIYVLLEKIPPSLCEHFPVPMIDGNGASCLDHMRMCGRLSDDKIFPYDFAARYVRPGDLVLDYRSGVGAGSYLLYTLTKAKKVLGIEDTKKFVEYASAMYQGNELEFIESASLDLSLIQNESIDLLVCFAGWPCTKSMPEMAKEFSRVLAPTGRLIINSGYERNSGEVAKERVTELAYSKALEKELEKYFLIEEVYAQGLNFDESEHDATRKFERIDAEISETNTNASQTIIVAFKSSKDCNLPFRESVYPYSSPPENLLNFSRDYTNGWLIREICEPEFRIGNLKLLTDRCIELIDAADHSSADYGAALCIYGYRVIENKERGFNFDEFESKVINYLNNPPANAHVQRWHTSLSYLMGFAFLTKGAKEQAREWFDKCIGFGYSSFSPVLATKVVGASRQIGFLLLSQGDVKGASQYFSKAMSVAFEAIRAPIEEWIGKPELPITCTYYDALGLLDDGFHSAILLSHLRSDYVSRVPFSEFVWSGGYRDPLLKKISSLHEVAEQRLAELQRLGVERQDLYEVAEQRLAELQRLGVERQDLYEVAEQRLAELQRLGVERQDLYEVAEQRLAELQRLGVERQDLYEVAEQRLAELQRLGVERQDLYEVAEQRLAELQRLGVERQDLYEVAEQRLAELQRLGVERQDLYEVAEQRLAELQRLGVERQDLYEVAEQRLAELQRLGVERQDLYEVAEQRLAELQRLGVERQDLYEVAEQRLAELQRLGVERQDLYEVAEQRLAELQRLGVERQDLYEVAEQRLADSQILVSRIIEFQNMGLVRFLLIYLKRKIYSIKKLVGTK